MLNISDLDFPGYKSQSTLGKFFQHEEPASRLAVIFPGYGYTCERAMLHYPMQLLLAEGIDALQVNYSFDNKPGFWQSGDQTRALWFGTDALAAMRTVMAKGTYEEITMVGKSLGSLAVAHVSTFLHHYTAMRGVVFTPLLKNPGLVQQLIAFQGSLLLVVGTADTMHDPAALKEIQAARDVTVIEVEGADHSLEVKSDVMRSLDLLKMVMEGVKQFLEATE